MFYQHFALGFSNHFPFPMSQFGLESIYLLISSEWKFTVIKISWSGTAPHNRTCCLSPACRFSSPDETLVKVCDNSRCLLYYSGHYGTVQQGSPLGARTSLRRRVPRGLRPRARLSARFRFFTSSVYWPEPSVATMAGLNEKKKKNLLEEKRLIMISVQQCGGRDAFFMWLSATVTFLILNFIFSSVKAEGH